MEKKQKGPNAGGRCKKAEEGTYSHQIPQGVVGEGTHDCSKHPGEKIVYFCFKTKEFVCNTCVFNDEIPISKATVKPIKEKDIVAHAELLKSNLKTHRDMVDQQLNEIEKIISKSVSLSDKQIQDIFNSASDLVTQGSITDKKLFGELTQYNKGGDL